MLKNGNQLVEEYHSKVMELFRRATSSGTELSAVNLELGGLEIRRGSEYELQDAYLLDVIARRVLPRGYEFVVHEVAGAPPQIFITRT